MTPPAAGAGGAPRATAPHALLAGVLGCLLAAIPLLHDRANFFRDDMETFFVPTLVAVGQTLWATGAVPLMTPLSWIGGNLAGEFQYGILNPVLLALYAALPVFERQDDAAAFLCVALGGILGSGGFVLARALRLDVKLAYAAAGAIAGNNALHYWFAMSWYPGFASAAFAVWAMAFLLRAQDTPGAFLGAVAATGLTATAGWPHALIALGIFTAAWMAAQWRAGGWRPAAEVGLAAALGVAAGGIALGPFLGMLGVAERDTVIVHTGLMTPNLRDLLALWNPVHLGTMQVFGPQVDLLRAPILHAAWFILPFAALLDWKRVDWRDPRILALTIFAGVMLLGTQGPSHLAWMRYPVKFVPFFHVALVLLALVLFRQAGLAPPSRGRALVLALVMAVGAIVSMQAAPALAVVHLGVAAVILYLALVMQRDAARGGAAVARILACSTWIVAAATRLALPSDAFPWSGNFARFGLPVERNQAVSLAILPESYDFAAFDVDALRLAPGIYAHMPVGQAGLAQGRAMVNGYAPLGHGGLAGLICWNGSRWACVDTLDRLLATDAATGVGRADLMRVRRLVVPAGPQADRLRAQVPPGWRVAAEDPLALVLERVPADETLPGSLSWRSGGIAVAPAGTPTATRETLRLAAVPEAGGRLVFARTGWAGYRATLDGMPLPVGSHAGALVAVDLPPGTRAATLELAFVPRGLQAGIAVSVLALLAALGHAAFLHRGRRRALALGAAPPR